MTTFTWGLPAEEGQTPPPGTGEYYVYSTRPDGTRLVVEYDPIGDSENHGVPVASGGPVPATPNRVIWIPTSGLRGPVQLEDPDDYFWYEYADDAGVVGISLVPTTPGDDFYRFRRIIADHAHRFLIEHNAANLQHTKRDLFRIEHLSHELTNDDRMRAGNVSELVRPHLGYLWVLLHEFAKMPATDTAVWHARRDELKVLIEEHLCAVCDGSGLSYRLMADHPKEEFYGYLQSQLRFSVDRDMGTHPIEGAGLVTPEVKSVDIDNFNNALDHFGKGYDDDDYGGDGLNPRSVVDAPPSSFVPPIPTMGEKLKAQTEILHWREQYQLGKNHANATPLRNVIWWRWCWVMVAASLRGYRNQVVRGGLGTNRAVTADVFFGLTLQRGRDPVPSPQFDAINQRFTGNPWMIPFAILDDSTFRTIPGPAILFVEGATPNLAALTALAAQVDSVLGDRTILPSS